MLRFTPKPKAPALPVLAALCCASLGGAQVLVSNGIEVIASSGAVAPGTGGLIFDLTALFDNVVIDEAGSVLFRGRLQGAGVTALNDRALFFGKNSKDLTMLIRGGDPAPGLPGLTLNNATTQGINGTVRISPDGRVVFASTLSGPGVVAANDTAFFGGFPGSLGVLVREGDQAPGAAVGTLMSSSFSSLSQQSSGLNHTGRVLFQTATAGGDTSGTANNAMWVTGLPGALELVQRKGDTVFGGAVVSALGFVSQMNDLGWILHDFTLSTTLGSTPATAANDRALWMWIPGSSPLPIVREGDPAPGTAGGTFGVASNSWFVNVGPNCFNRAGNCVFTADLTGGDASAGINDRAIYRGGAGGLAMIVRRGDPAPGTDASFGQTSNSNIALNGNTEIVFGTALVGGTSTPADDYAIYTTVGSVLQLVARESQVIPGTGGIAISSLDGNQVYLNDRGNVLFASTLTGGPLGAEFASALCAWDAVLGLTIVSYVGAPAVGDVGTFTASTTGAVQFNNGDGAALFFNHAGWFAMRMQSAEGPNYVVKGRVSSLFGSPLAISEAIGGVHRLQLGAGAANAGKLYFVAGSLAGTTPGFPFGAVTVPLNPDAYFNFTVTSPNVPPLAGTLGTLSAEGRGNATLTVPAGVSGLAGATVNHAFLAIDLSTVTATMASEPAALSFVP
jgi:hypothetical protein